MPSSDAAYLRLLEAAKRIAELAEAHGLPDGDTTSFAIYNEWVAAMFALKEAVRDAEQ